MVLGTLPLLDSPYLLDKITSLCLRFNESEQTSKVPLLLALLIYCMELTRFLSKYTLSSSFSLSYQSGNERNPTKSSGDVNDCCWDTMNSISEPQFSILCNCNFLMILPDLRNLFYPIANRNKILLFFGILSYILDIRGIFLFQIIHRIS